jgi:TonB family protein
MRHQSKALALTVTGICLVASGFLAEVLAQENPKKILRECSNEKNSHWDNCYGKRGVYEGEWKNNKPHGYGTYKNSGTTYVGQFSNGTKNGYGEQTTESGNSYKGEFKNNEYDGRGKLTFRDGTFLEGNFEKGQFVYEIVKESDYREGEQVSGVNQVDPRDEMSQGKNANMTKNEKNENSSNERSKVKLSDERKTEAATYDLRKNRLPEYPNESFKNAEQGTVVLDVLVTSEGSVGNVSVIESSGFWRLDEAAIKALWNWKFNPAKENGIAINQSVKISIPFKIRTADDVREEQRRADAEQEIEDEKRRKWLETPEGKRYQAVEAARAKREEEQRTRAAEKEKERLSKEFPFVAVITCGMGNNHISMTACIGDHGSIEIRNGEDYGLYQIYHVANRMIPNSFEDRKGLIVNLRRRFEITARNGDDLILGVKIHDRASGKILFQKQVSKYRAIKVRD